MGGTGPRGVDEFFQQNKFSEVDFWLKSSCVDFCSNFVNFYNISRLPLKIEHRGTPLFGPPSGSHPSPKSLWNTQNFSQKLTTLVPLLDPKPLYLYITFLDTLNYSLFSRAPITIALMLYYRNRGPSALFAPLPWCFAFCENRVWPLGSENLRIVALFAKENWGAMIFKIIHFGAGIVIEQIVFCSWPILLRIVGDYHSRNGTKIVSFDPSILKFRD